MPSSTQAGTSFDGSQAGLVIQNLASALTILAKTSTQRTAAVVADSAAFNTDKTISGDANCDLQKVFRFVLS
jgi:hypothetical protein